MNSKNGELLCTDSYTLMSTAQMFTEEDPCHNQYKLAGMIVHLDLQQVMPNGKGALADVLLTNAEANQVCHFDGASLARQEL